MPTVTKPKRPIDLKITPVKIAPKQRRNMAESAGLHHTSRAGKAFLRDVESAITWHSNMIGRVPHRSLPAHTIAALKPIAKLAADLAMAFDAERLPIEVRAALGDEVLTGRAYLYLTELAATVRQAIGELEGRGSQGVLDHRLKDARERALDDLGALYEDFASGDCDADDRAEFLETCGKLLGPRNRASG